ncbi:MAG: hypothetical protein ACM3MB_09935, partial [Acidobacteriota bacterium]
MIPTRTTHECAIINIVTSLNQTAANLELHHEIFGSILDRSEMTPFLLLPATDYETALAQASKMMGNRGFDIL